MPTPPVIRPARPADAPAVRECAAAAYARYIPAIGRDPAPMHADFGAQIAAGEVHLATDAADVLLGFVVFRVAEDHVFLENVAVRPEAASQGVGGALIRFCEAETLRRGLAAVHLYTNEKMTANLSLYPRLGYVEVDRRREDGFDRVYFEKALR